MKSGRCKRMSRMIVSKSAMPAPSGTYRSASFLLPGRTQATLDNYVKTYNHRIPQRALNHLSPVQALKKWQAEKPELFVKRV